ncbi:MAG: carbon starvation protein A [bacterium]
MNALILLLLSISLFVLGYLWYSRLISRWLGVDRKRPTPAHTKNDGIDYVPAPKPVLLGHHFASIAGAAPIIGPITASAFGWLPVYIWIILGGIFIGAVHDFTSIFVSIRHEGRSIGEIIEKVMGLTGKKLFLIFSWSTLTLVVAVFTIVVAKTFAAVPQAATSSMLFIFISVGFGLGIRKGFFNIAGGSLIGIIALIGCLAAGIYMPLQLGMKSWVYILIGYVFIASVAPVWMLLQPRDYLNSFLLYAMLGFAVLGIVLFNPPLRLSPISSFYVPQLGYLFPILFVTVACGAISGFHSLVSSGTTAKQLNCESDARTIGYGGMLIESCLAVIALITAVYLTQKQYFDFMGVGKSGPIALFSNGIGEFLSHLGIPIKTGTSFTALAVSAFAMTSLDTAARLGRFAFQEFFENGVIASESVKKVLCNRYFATFITTIGGGLLAFSGQWKSIWPIFGTANQLLAAIALLTVTVYLIKEKRNYLFTGIPALIMMIITLSSLASLIYKNTIMSPDPGQAAISIFLFGIAVFLLYVSFKTLNDGKKVLNATASP